MSIRLSLLAILDQGPCYGYQLRLEFERRTGGSWPLNVGQVYTTLDRLERDGLAVKGGVDSAGRVLYDITAAGRAQSAQWLGSAVERPDAARDELALKLAIAVTLPGADAAAIVRSQRAATATAVEQYRGESLRLAEADPAALARQLVLDSRVFAAEAELAWLDHCEALVSRSTPFPIEWALPRRGRPARSEIAEKRRNDMLVIRPVHPS